MVRSMTGFGQAFRHANGFVIQIDMKSVNHRYCEVVVRSPREWAHLEDAWKKTIQQAVKRGRIDVFLSLERDREAEPRVSVNLNLARAYLQAAEQLREAFGIEEKLGLKELLALPDLIDPEAHAEEEREPLGRAISETLGEALAAMVRMRETEGAALLRDLEQRVARIEALQAQAAVQAPAVVEESRARLQERMRELLRDTDAVQESRLAMEVALHAERADIAEELTRLSGHCRHCRELFASREPIGRKLDFLAQEMNREMNTIGSKSSNLEIASAVIEMKAELEKFREQVQNIE